MKVHKGWIVAFAAVVLLSGAVMGAPGQKKELTADELVAKVIVARGGIEKIKGIQAERVTGTISFGPGADGPFAVELKRPGKMRMEMSFQGMSLVRSFDGKSAGWANNPFIGKKDIEAMTEQDLRNISEESDFDGPLVDYKAKGNDIKLVGKDTVEGKDAWRLQLTTKNGDVRSYLFDGQTFLLLKWEGRRKGADGSEFPVESFFRDYRELNGMKFAFEIDSDRPGQPGVQKILVDKIELNPTIDDARFGKPALPAAPSSASPPSN